MEEAIAATIGTYAGGLLITYVITRLCHHFLGFISQVILRVIVVFIISTTAIVGLGSITMGIHEATVIYLPCILIWLVYDLWKLRTGGVERITKGEAK